MPRIERLPFHLAATTISRFTGAAHNETSYRVIGDQIRTKGSLERYSPRVTSRADAWQVGSTCFKVYGLLAGGKSLTSKIMKDAEEFLREDVALAIDREGAQNGAGFVIVHPGELGVSTSAHWWVQGSVLCQRIRRQLYGAESPMDVATRPVIACVWELAIINAEQCIWRETMMGVTPDLAAYLSRHISEAFV